MIMDSTTMESCVPPGFRFHPTEEELVGYYLRKKVALQKIDLDVIREVDLYKIEPWDLQDTCWIGYEEQKEWYFFSYNDKKYPTGTRTNRATMAGFWKATGRDKAVYDKTKLIGMRKTLVFYKGRAPNGHKSDWIMHEYRLESQENGHPQDEGWVVCRAFKKRMTNQTKTNNEGLGSTHYYDHEPFVTGQQPSIILSKNLINKRETEASENRHFVKYSNQLAQLPDLESPSMKNPIIKSGTNNNSKKVADWRDLDKFVASQLSHGDYRDHETGNELRFDHDHKDLDLGCLDGAKLNEILSSSSNLCDIGICLFDKEA